MQFKVEQRRSWIVLFGQGMSSLEKKIELLIKYTKDVDPNAPLKEVKIQELSKKNKLFDEGFTHAVVLNDILPRVVRVLYGNHNLGRYNGNCHGTACVAAGVFPAMTNGFPVNNMKQVSFDDLSPGDIISLKGLDHSFVYLDKDLCLSMNGRGEAFEFHCLKDVLELYGSSLQILSKENSDKITIYRKLPDWIYPESIMSTLLEYYEIVAEGSLSYQLPSDRHATRLIAVAEKLQQETIGLAQDNKKLPLEKLYDKITSTMPSYAVPKAVKFNVEKVIPQLSNVY